MYMYTYMYIHIYIHIHIYIYMCVYIYMYFDFHSEQTWCIYKYMSTYVGWWIRYGQVRCWRTWRWEGEVYTKIEKSYMNAVLRGSQTPLQETIWESLARRSRCLREFPATFPDNLVTRNHVFSAEQDVTVTPAVGKYVHISLPHQNRDTLFYYIFRTRWTQVWICLVRAYMPFPLTRNIHALLSCAMRVGALCSYPRSSKIHLQCTKSSAHCNTL